MTIIEMRKKRSETWEKAKNFLDTHRNASGIHAMFHNRPLFACMCFLGFC